MKSIHRSAIAIVGVALLAATACLPLGPKVWVTEESDRSESAAGIEVLAVTTHNGAIKVTGKQDAGEIAIHITKRAGALTDEEASACLKAVQIESRVESNTLHLGWKWGVPKQKDWQGGVNFEVVMPQMIAPRAISHNGHVEVKNLNAAIVIETHNGAVKVEDITGDVDLKTSNGRVDTANTVGDLKAVTHNGGVTVEKAVGSIAVESHNGKIEVQAKAPSIDVGTHNGAARVDLTGSDVVNGRIETSNGSVALRLGEEASVRVAARTGNGQIRLDREITVKSQKKNSLDGQVGGGDGLLEIHTSNGSITIE